MDSKGWLYCHDFPDDTASCCNSCHEDAYEGYYGGVMIEGTFKGHKIEVCCAISNAIDAGEFDDFEPPALPEGVKPV